jgi:hypothetical protein
MTTYSIKKTRGLKYDHPFSSNATGTGSLTLISSQTASASATFHLQQELIALMMNIFLSL